jgi:hypothetical protein
LSTREQAALVLRWFLDDTRMSQLARDNAISRSTAYEYRDEAIAVLAARRPGLPELSWSPSRPGTARRRNSAQMKPAAARVPSTLPRRPDRLAGQLP